MADWHLEVEGRVWYGMKWDGRLSDTSISLFSLYSSYLPWLTTELTLRKDSGGGGGSVDKKANSFSLSCCSMVMSVTWYVLAKQAQKPAVKSFLLATCLIELPSRVFMMIYTLIALRCHFLVPMASLFHSHSHHTTISATHHHEDHPASQPRKG